MRIQGSLGMVLLAAGLTCLAACGDDNDFVVATPTVGAPTSTRTAAVQPTTPPGGPTATTTNTPSGPVVTPTPSLTPATPLPTVTGAFCGNHVIDAGEECDCGAVCLKGDEDKLGQECRSDGECGSGGDCEPVGGQPTEQSGGPDLPGACPPDEPGPCAANCTLETVVPMVFKNTCSSGSMAGTECDPNMPNQCGNTCTARNCGCLAGSGSRVQLTTGPLFLPIQGTQTFRVGKVSSSDVMGPPDSANVQKRLFNAGDIPLAVRATDFNFDKIIVPTLACTCVRAFELAELGPGLAGVGVIACGAGGLTNVDNMQTVDHNRGVISDEDCKALDTPGQNGPLGGTEVGGGTCVIPAGASLGTCEGESGGQTWQPGDPCLMSIPQCTDPHPTICNYVESPPTFGASGPTGSSVLKTYTSISSITNGGTCDDNPDIFEYGPDHKACTDDDFKQLPPSLNFTTTGTTTAALLNANPRPLMPTVPTGIPINIGSQMPCTPGQTCPGTRERCFNVNNLAQNCAAGQTCECRTACLATACGTTISGHPYQCSVLMTNTAEGLATGQTAIAFGAVHAAAGLDLVATTTFELKPAPASSAEEPSN